MEIMNENTKRNSTFKASSKIKCLIEMTLSNVISWATLHSAIDKLTPTFEKSKQVNKLLLQELEKLQKNRLENDELTIDGFHDEIDDLEKDHFNAEELKLRHENNSEEDITKIIEEKKVSKELMETTIFNIEDDISTVHEDNKSENNFSEAYSEHEEVIHEKEVSKSIQLVEAFKGQLYTFVGENSKESFDENDDNQSFNPVLKSNMAVCSKRTQDFLNSKCDICGKCYFKSSLERHERIHTGEKPFKCKHCNKRFTQSSGLLIHEKIHTGEKPFICKTCKKGFVKPSDLKRHVIIHTGEKPYQCKICTKALTRLSSLKDHEKIHTGEKPYQCKICNKTFRDGSNYRKHVKNCDKEECYE